MVHFNYEFAFRKETEELLYRPKETRENYEVYLNQTSTHSKRARIDNVGQTKNLNQTFITKTETSQNKKHLRERLLLNKPLHNTNLKTEKAVQLHCAKCSKTHFAKPNLNRKIDTCQARHFYRNKRRVNKLSHNSYVLKTLSLQLQKTMQLHYAKLSKTT